MGALHSSPRMTGIGTGYDLYPTTFSPEGRLFQIEYAGKAADTSGTAVGICCKDGVVLGVEKLIRSKMLVKGSEKRIFTTAPHAGMALAGLLADGRQIVNRCREEAANYKRFYGQPIPGKMLNQRLSSFIQFYTLNGLVRPFGASVILGVYDKNGPSLYMVEPSGISYGYHGVAVGQGKQLARTELENLSLKDLTAREAAIEVAKIIYKIHDDVKDKEFELELSWVCAESNGRHQHVPDDLLAEAIAAGQRTVEAEQFESDEEMDI